MKQPGFADHFSAVAADYASARPEYPEALFAWIASVAPARGVAWEAGCGSGQASRGLAAQFGQVHATDPSAAQIAQAHGPGNITFVVGPGERCTLPDASVDAACVAQALHWFDRAAFFAQCARVLKPDGVLVAWGYQDIQVPAALAAANAALQDDIRDYWPPERALVDNAYAGFDWPFVALEVPAFELCMQWTLPRLLGWNIHQNDDYFITFLIATHLATAIVLLGIISGALFYGDAIITPAISVLSGVEGITTVQAGFAPFVIPLAMGLAIFGAARIRFDALK